MKPAKSRVISAPQRQPIGPAWQAAIDYGIDVEQLAYNLTLTPAERLRQHERARRFIATLIQARIAHYGFDPALPETPPPPER